MTTTYFIAGAVFAVSMIAWKIIGKRMTRNKNLEEAKRDLKKAIDNHDSDAYDDARRRVQFYEGNIL